MTPIQAAYEVAHHGQLPLSSLARRISKSATTLCHEVKPPPRSRAKLGLADAMRITEAQNDDRILLAWAQQRGYHCVPITKPVEDNKPGDLLRATCSFAKETGEALAAMHQAIESGRITEREVHCFEREVSEIAPAAIALVQRMRAAALAQAKSRAIAPALRGIQQVPLKNRQRIAAASGITA